MKKYIIIFCLLLGSFSSSSAEDNTVIKTGQTVDLNIKLTNKSKYAGDEVIQVYIKNKVDKDGPIKSFREHSDEYRLLPKLRRT